MKITAKLVEGAVVDQNFEVIDLIAELLNVYQKHKDECDRVMVVIRKTLEKDYAFDVFLETDDLT